MRTYRVEWSIDIEADMPKQAARAALKIQRDPDSIATVFDVFNPEPSFSFGEDIRAWRIDLTADDEDRERQRLYEKYGDDRLRG